MRSSGLPRPGGLRRSDRGRVGREARSPGSIAGAGSGSDRRARDPRPVPRATTVAAPTRPSPTPTSSSATSTRPRSPAATSRCAPTSHTRRSRGWPTAWDCRCSTPRIGIFTIATATMRRAVRAVSVERGRDPRDARARRVRRRGRDHAAALGRRDGDGGGRGPDRRRTVLQPGIAVRRHGREPDRGRARAAASRRSGSAIRGRGRQRLARQAVPWSCRAGRLSLANPEVEIRAVVDALGPVSTLMLPMFQGRHRRARRRFPRRAPTDPWPVGRGEPVEVTAVRVRAFWPAPPLTFAEIARLQIASGTRARGETRRCIRSGARHDAGADRDPRLAPKDAPSDRARW